MYASVHKGLSSQGYGFSCGHVWMWELDCEEGWVLKDWCFWTVVRRRLLRVPWNARRSNQSILKGISPESSLKDWGWSSNILAIWCEELTHWKRPWFCEKLKAGEGDDRGWDGWMASLTRWTWVWANSGTCLSFASKEQGSLAHCSPWGHKELDTTERLNNNSQLILTSRKYTG